MVPLAIQYKLALHQHISNWGAYSTHDWWGQSITVTLGNALCSLNSHPFFSQITRRVCHTMHIMQLHDLSFPTLLFAYHVEFQVILPIPLVRSISVYDYQCSSNLVFEITSNVSSPHFYLFSILKYCFI